MISNDDQCRPQSALFGLLERDDFVEGRVWQRQNFRSREIILKEGSCCGKVFLVAKGMVRALGTVEIGSDCHIRPGVKDFGPGEVFGEISWLDHGQHTATIMAVSECELFVIDGSGLLEYLQGHPEVGCRVFHELAVQLAQRLRLADRRIFNLLGWGLKARDYDKYIDTE